jgi:hypothetical protein
MPRARGRALAFGLAGLLLLGGAAGLARAPLARGLAGPGGLLDLSRTGPLSLDLDGRPVRVTVAGKSWDFEAGDLGRGRELSLDGKPFLAPRDAALLVSDLALDEQSLANGDEGYPRWDGSAWILDAGALAAPSPDQASTARDSTAEAGARKGRLYIRNLSKQKLTIRSLDPGAPDLNWTFTPLEAADEPGGHYLSYTGGGEPAFGPSSRIEILLKDGSRRVLALERSAAWKGTGSWLLELAP